MPEIFSNEGDSIEAQQAKFSRRGLERHLERILAGGAESKDVLAGLTDEEVRLLSGFFEGGVAEAVGEERGKLAVELQGSLANLPEIRPEEQKQSFDLMRSNAMKYRHLERAREEAPRVFREKVLPRLRNDALIVAMQERIRTQDGVLNEQMRHLLVESPETFIGISLIELRHLKRQMNKTGIAETQWVKEQEENINQELDRGNVVFLAGETGTGKTVIAQKIARERAERKHPEKGDAVQIETINGHKFMTREELWGYLGLAKPDKIESSTVPDLIRQAREKYRQEREGVDESPETLFDEETIRRVEEGQAVDGATITKYFWGPVLKAAEDGKICVIDEFNYIPPGLFASLNEIMAKMQRAARGERVTVTSPDNREVEIKKGAGIVVTGNVTHTEMQRYLERVEFDPALLDRLKTIFYSTPPQEIDANFQSSKESASAYAEGEAAKERDLYQIALAKLVDEKANLRAPEDALAKVWALCSAFKTFQKNFAGDPLRPEDQFTQGGSRIEARLAKIHASIRKLERVVDEWKESGFEHELDQHVYDVLVKPARLYAPGEAAYFYQILRNKYGFFRSDGWDDNPNYGSGGIVRTFSPAVPGRPNKPEALKFYQPAEIAEAFQGVETPWGAGNVREAADMGRMEAAMEMERMLEDAKEKVRILSERVDEFCEDEAALNQMNA